jgi:hypothetical protein
MAKRILLAGVLGGLALFMWGGLAHMVLGLGEVGIQYLPQQQRMMDALKTATSQSGMYFFPQRDQGGNVPAVQAGGPWGILIYHSSGASGMRPGQLVNECILNIVVALFAAFLLSLAAGLNSYPKRVGFVTLLGATVAIMTNLEYLNWYEFPLNYTLAQILEVVIGFLIVGLIAGAFVKSTEPRVVTMPARAA